ncbi:hypothetical protein [Bradyrhizobium sp. USDA 4506]
MTLFTLPSSRFNASTIGVVGLDATSLRHERFAALINAPHSSSPIQTGKHDLPATNWLPDANNCHERRGKADTGFS